MGALFNDAKNKGFLRGVDGNLLTAIRALDSWLLTENESNRGKSHGASDADGDDVQLSIHRAAALTISLMKLNPTDASREAGAGKGV